MSDPTRPLFGAQRRERLLAELHRDGSVSVREVAVRLGVSELTVRRDVNALVDLGFATRVHGGAVLPGGLAGGASGGSPTAGGSPSGADRAGWAEAAGLHPLPSPVRTLGMVVPSLDYYWPQIIAGARSAAARREARIVLRAASYDAADDAQEIAALVEAPGIHALLVAPDVSGDAGRALLTRLDQLPIPVVLLERRVPDDLPLVRLETVTTDHAAGAALAVRHLRAQGHVRVGLLTSASRPSSPAVEAGWRRAVAEGGGADPDGADRHGHVPLLAGSDGFSSPDRERIMDAILGRCRTTGTTALLIHSDPQAVAFEQHCVDRGLRVPDDLAIVAHDDEVAHLGTPPLTAVRPPKHHVGRTAVELALARLDEGGRRPRADVVFTPELVVRDSSAAGAGAVPRSGPDATTPDPPSVN